MGGQGDHPLAKPCTGCLEVRPLGWFRRAGTLRDGTPRRSSRCRECEKVTHAHGKKVRRKRILAQTVGKVTARDVKALGERQSWRCACGCGRVIRWAYHIDHIVPLARGGLHTLSNLQLLAPVCNLRKGAKLQ